MEIFLILVLTGIALLVNIVPSAGNKNLEKPKPKVADPSNKKSSQKSSDKAVFVTTRIAGVEYNNEDGSVRESIIKVIKSNEVLNLVKDPSNKYDKYAIKIMSKYGCVGFLPRYLSKYIQSVSVTYGKGSLEKRKPGDGRYEYYVRLEVEPGYDAAEWFYSRILGKCASNESKISPESLMSGLKKELVEKKHLKVYESLSRESLDIIGYEIIKSYEARLKQQDLNGLEAERAEVLSNINKVDDGIRENSDWFSGARNNEFCFTKGDVENKKKEAKDLYFYKKASRISWKFWKEKSTKRKLILEE